jgi:thiaminase (transcriptional activator TenA)
MPALVHGSYAARWGLDLAEVAPLPATLAYTDFLLATAAVATVGDTCAAMAPCMRLYAYLGQSLTADPPARRDQNPYSEWIDTYAATDFESLASRLEQLLDRYASDDRAVRSAYRRAMQLELAFFTAACS